MTSVIESLCEPKLVVGTLCIWLSVLSLRLYVAFMLHSAVRVRFDRDPCVRFIDPVLPAVCPFHFVTLLNIVYTG